MRKFHYIAGFILLFSGMGGIHAIADDSDMVGFLPGADFEEGWKFAGDLKRYSPENLYQIVNGAASLYHSYGFRELVHTRYERENNPERGITIDLYDMGTLEGGYGLYSSGRHPTEDFQPFGTQGYRSDALLIGWKGPYYVHLMGDDSHSETIETLEALGRFITSKIPGEDAYPNILRCLPAKDRIPHTGKYSTKDFLGYDFLTNTISARYLIQSETVTLFVGNCGDDGKATTVFDTFTAQVKASPLAQYQPYLGVAERYLGNLLIGRSRQYVYGAYSETGTVKWDSLKDAMTRCTHQLLAVRKDKK